MRFFLAGGAILLVLIIGGVVASMNGGRRTGDIASIQPIAPVEEGPKPLETGPVAETVRSDVSVLAEAEPLAREFLEATTIEQILPLVRDPEAAEVHMRRFYPEGKVEAPGMAKFNSSGVVTMLGPFRSIMVTTRDFETKPLVFTDSPGEMKIDWEAWVGWSDMPWHEFRASKPSKGQVFRVHLSAVDYYNFDFKDDSKWQSYRLESPDQKHAIYGYVERGSTLDQRIRPNADTKSMALMLSLKFPEAVSSDDQVEIERFVNEGWVEKRDSK